MFSLLWKDFKESRSLMGLSKPSSYQWNSQRLGNILESNDVSCISSWEPRRALLVFHMTLLKNLADKDRCICFQYRWSQQQQTSSAGRTDVEVWGRGTVVILKLEPKLLLVTVSCTSAKGVLYKTTIKSDDSFMCTPQLLQMTRNTAGWQTKITETAYSY